MEELTRLEEALANGAQVAIGSREGDTLVECGPIRRFLGRWFNRAVRFGAVGGIRDTQCGFKLFDRPSALRLFGATQEDGYAFDVELLFLAQRWDIDVREIGVNWTEQAGSKVSLLPDGVSDVEGRATHSVAMEGRGVREHRGPTGEESRSDARLGHARTPRPLQHVALGHDAP